MSEPDAEAPAPEAPADAPPQVSSPSYMISAIGGIFLGIFGMAVLIFFMSLSEDRQWVIGVVPLVGLFAAILGTYVSAEPYEELRTLYDRLIGDAAMATRMQVDENTSGMRTRLEEIAARLGRESARLAKEAAELGADGIKVAEAAQVLREEAEKCIK